MLRIIQVYDNCINCPHHEYDSILNIHDCFVNDGHYGRLKNYPEPLDNCPIKPVEGENEILINNIELASELAHERTFDELVEIGWIEEDMWNTDEQGNKTYVDEAQDIHTRWYDYYRDIIDKANLLK